MAHQTTKEMAQSTTLEEPPAWNTRQKVVFRWCFIFFCLLAVPLDWTFYRDLFSIHWRALHFYDLFQLSQYLPQVLPESDRWGVGSYANVALVGLVAVMGAALWSGLDSSLDKKNTHYTKLYYWLRVVVRYRLAAGMVAFGFIKLFPLQMPYPSLSNLHTNYGDFLNWKIYWHTLGLTQGYESFLGFVEILAGGLLFYRRTVPLGAAIVLGFTGHVLAVNMSYGVGQHVYSACLVGMAAFLFAHDVPRLYQLLDLQQTARANRFRLDFSQKGLKNTRLALKSAFVVFVALYGFLTYANYREAPYLLPRTPGLRGAYGYYNVRQFRLNSDTIPYSVNDPDRWQNVVFEPWATLSIRIARPVKIDLTDGKVWHEKDIDRTFESAGVGGRHYFAYEADTVKHILSLQNKNPNHRNEKLSLGYHFPNDSTLVLAGINENRDSIHVVLDKINRQYMLFAGRRKPLKM